MMDGIVWYDRRGRPLDMAEAEPLLRDPDYRRVALDRVGPYEVSTVWLGLDHGFGLHARPVIFETMVFSADEWHDTEREPGLHEIDCRRYATEEEARAGHAEMVTLIRATLQEDPPREI